MQQPNFSQGSLIPFAMQIQQPAQTYQPVEPPARVKAAMEFLYACSQKMMTRAAVNDMSIETIEGQKLTTEEEATHTAACVLLSKYFDGKLQQDCYEQGEVRQRGTKENPGTVIRCFACYPDTAKANCHFCKGTGQVIVYPAAEG